MRQRKSALLRSIVEDRSEEVSLEGELSEGVEVELGEDEECDEVELVWSLLDGGEEVSDLGEVESSESEVVLVPSRSSVPFSASPLSPPPILSLPLPLSLFFTFNFFSPSTR